MSRETKSDRREKYFEDIDNRPRLELPKIETKSPAQSSPSRKSRRTGVVEDYHSKENQIVPGLTGPSFMGRHNSPFSLQTSSVINERRSDSRLRSQRSAGSRECSLSQSHTTFNHGEESLTPGVRSEASRNNEFTFDDYDIMTDVNTEAPPPRNKNDHIMMYVASCRQLGVVPISRLRKRFNSRYLGGTALNMGVDGARAVAIALVKNTDVEIVDLESNDIGDRGAIAMAQLCSKNMFISDLNVAFNGISGKGIQCLCDVISESKTLEKLDISGNHFDENDAVHIAMMIEKNKSMTRLSLRHNDFSVNGGVILGEALRNNDYIESLDLSWNHIRGAGAVAIGNSLQHNCTIKYIDLSWNGFARDGGIAVGEALKHNRTLLWLDISCNRLAPHALRAVIQGALQNDKLITLELGLNAISPEMAMIILNLLEKMGDDCALREIDMGETVVNDEFLVKLESIRENKLLRVKHGPTIGQSKDLIQFVEGVCQDMNPVKELYQFMNKEGLRVRDLFDRLDLNKDDAVDRSEFIVGMTRIGLTPTKKHLDEIFKALDTNNDGRVDLMELMELRQKQFTSKKVSGNLVKERSNKKSVYTASSYNNLL